MNTYTKFKKACIEMYKAGEVDKIYKTCERSERKRVKHDIRILAQLVILYEANNQELDSFSIFSFMPNLKSAEVFKNALCYMLRYDDKEA